MEVKHSHVFSYDESNQSSKHWCWDKPEENSGLEAACNMINGDINQMLDNIRLTNSIEADNLLDDFMHANQEDENPIPKANVIKACSEALSIAVAKCFG